MQKYHKHNWSLAFIISKVPASSSLLVKLGQIMNLTEQLPLEIHREGNFLVLSRYIFFILIIFFIIICSGEDYQIQKNIYILFLK